MTTAPAQPTARDVLTQTEAAARAARVSGVEYTLALDLTRGSATYKGDVSIKFHLDGAGETFLDFRGKTISTLDVNGKLIDAASLWSGYRLMLPADALHADNIVRIEYENEYDHTGDGFHQFIDPEDNEEYLYTNFEPYESHRLFPNFDQPDIKAIYTLSVTAPADWELISNAPESGSSPAGDRVAHTFATTKPFSTYLFALIAGPYQAVRSDHRGIPLGLFCRQSLVKYLDTEELFTVTRQGLDFYEDFFATPYAFGKYDQIFVPEFNAGAMENVGAITHSERLIFRDPPTDTQRLSRAEVVLHEMAHMWFGDLVTMRWWNDLWLNESFATYMAYLALASNTRFTSAWQSFNSGMKSWAYRQDQLVTTHPIAGEVPDTEHTFLNFDGITYGKGASVIKQLVAAMGLEGFRNGMRIYFSRHAYGNTTLSQWLDALGEGVGRDLHVWAQAWLETPSLNTISANWDADGDRISRLALVQTALAEYPTFRPHHLEVALVRGNANGAATIEAVPADISGGEAEVPGAVGKPAPDFVMPNYNDHGFVKVALDEKSLEFVRDGLRTIEDPLLRQITWQALWNMVRDQQLRSTDYLDLVAHNIGSEVNPELIESILAGASGAIARFIPDADRDAAAHRFFEVAWDLLQKAPQGDMQITWARTLIGIAITPDDIRHCARLADGEVTVEGLTIDQAMRWEIAARFVGYGIDGAQARVDEEKRRDPSDRGQRALLRCEVSVPDPAVKAAAWEKFKGEGYGSLHLTSAAMGGFQWYCQRELLAPYAEKFFEDVTGVFQAQPHEFARAYFGALFPDFRVSREVLMRSGDFLSTVSPELPTLVRSLQEANDDLERAIKCREFAQG